MKDTIFNLRLSEKDKNKIFQEAEKRGISAAELIRQLCTETQEKRKEKKEKMNRQEALEIVTKILAECSRAGECENGCAFARTDGTECLLKGEFPLDWTIAERIAELWD